jgi:uncharacterized lipoprotein YbaY
MKALSILLVAAAMLVACGKKEEPAPAPVVATPAVVDTAAASADTAAQAK